MSGFRVSLVVAGLVLLVAAVVANRFIRAVRTQGSHRGSPVESRPPRTGIGFPSMEDDKDLIEHIEQLAHEEHAVRQGVAREASTKERTRLKEIEGELEASYDLLRLGGRVVRRGWIPTSSR